MYIEENIFFYIVDMPAITRALALKLWRHNSRVARNSKTGGRRALVSCRRRRGW